MPVALSPQGAAGLSAVARKHNPQAVMWRGDQGLPTAQQGLKVLGAPVGHPDYIQSFLTQKRVGARPSARDDPTGPRRAGSMVVVVVLRINPSEFLLEDSGSGIHPRVC